MTTRTTPNTPNAAERPSGNYALACAEAQGDIFTIDTPWGEVSAWIEQRARALDSHRPAESVSADYPECSGDPACCPENEGFGCCKPNPQPSTPGAVSDEDVGLRLLTAAFTADDVKVFQAALRNAGAHCVPAVRTIESAFEELLESFAKRAAPPAQAVSVQRRRDAAMAELSRDDVLPCDVLVAPGTIIRAGCNVSTLLLCLGNRVGREIAKLGPRGEIQAPQAVSVPGFVLVPKVATPEMMADGRTALRAGEMHINDAVHSVYKAMLSAVTAAATREDK